MESVKVQNTNSQILEEQRVRVVKNKLKDKFILLPILGRDIYDFAKIRDEKATLIHIYPQLLLGDEGSASCFICRILL